MATRTINLRMILDRGEEGLELRKALWTTHEEVNRAVAAIEGILLLCRGASYWTLDDDGDEVIVPEKQVREEALEMARAAQAANGRAGAGSDEEVLRALRFMYKALVPSCLLDAKGNPVKGDAQRIGQNYAGPLTDVNCDPFEELAKKVIPRFFDQSFLLPCDAEEYDRESPEFCRLTRNGADVYYRIDAKKALAWAEGKGRHFIEQKVAGADDTWIKQYRAGDAKWAVSLMRKQNLLGGDPRLRLRFHHKQKLGLLPIAQPHFEQMLWNRLAFRLAVAHMLSWESWNHRTARQYDRVLGRLEAEKKAAEPLEELIDRLRDYERERHEELKRVAKADDENPYRLLGRAVRGFDRVMERWRGGAATAAARKKVLDELQTRLRGRFGDPAFFNWLAEEGREPLWDAVAPLVRLNTLERLLARKRRYALYTPADARLHPRWACYEAPGGGNLRNYSLAQDGTLEIDLLSRDAGGQLSEKRFTIPLAPSGQLQDLKVEGKGRSQRYAFRSAHQDFTAKPGGAEILFDRRFTENRSPSRLSEGEIGPVWFKLTLDVDPKAPDDWIDRRGAPKRPAEALHFMTALVNRSKYEGDLAPGLRVLSVDLGLRSFAACSVFELVEGRPTSRLHFPAQPDKDLWARHERSFVLSLPGEKVGARERAERDKAFGELRSLRRDIARLKGILRMGMLEEPAARTQAYQRLRGFFGDEEVASAFDESLIDNLEKSVSRAPAVWRARCKEVFDAAEVLLGRRIGEWRRRTRPRPESWQDWRERRGYAGGKSIWRIEYLDAVRRLLMGWSLRGREYGEINRLSRRERGTFAARLLAHINNLKDDRTKAGADLIVQAARGYVPCGRGWEQRYEPCRLILFEDLARYRFRTDRPRRENSRLMKWNHRSILAEVEMQAAIYGMSVETVAAGFSSRFHAATGAPGVRCRRLTEDDFDAAGAPKDYVVGALERFGRAAGLSPGALVPWEGGELFAALRPDGKPVIVNADINAALNLQRRFWTRCGDAYRLPCLRALRDGEECWYPQRAGKRLRGALSLLGDVGESGYCRLVTAGRDNAWRAVGASAAEWRRATGSVGSTEDEEGADEVDEALASVPIEADSKRRVFFRDPSGALAGGQWLEGKVFWGETRKTVMSALRRAGIHGDGGKDDAPF